MADVEVNSIYRFVDEGKSSTDEDKGRELHQDQSELNEDTALQEPSQYWKYFNRVLDTGQHRSLMSHAGTLEIFQSAYPARCG